MVKISRLKILGVIQESKSFECTFVKKDKTIRDMRCTFEDIRSKENTLITVWDIDNNGYRYVNLETILTLSIKDIDYKII